MLDRIVAVEPRPNYHVWIRFEDGQEGEVSLAHLVGQGVFTVWKDESEFRKVHVDEDAGTIVWPGGLDVAPDGLRRRLDPTRHFSPTSVIESVARGVEQAARGEGVELNEADLPIDEDDV